MRVAIYPGEGRPATIEHVPDPSPGPGEVVVRVERCGVCGSDVSMTSGSPFDFPAGPLGHETAGEVVELGAGVTGLRIGDRVACPAGGNCGVCDDCDERALILCAGPRAYYGGFGEYLVVDARHAIRVPDGVSMADAALAEPIAVGLHALRMAGLRGGEDVVVLGAGSSALALVYWARRLGAGSVVVASRSEHRRAVAEQMGADRVVGFDDVDVGSADIVAECVGRSGMLDKAVSLVRPGGAVLSIGMCTDPDPVRPLVCGVKEIRLLFPTTYSLTEYVATVEAFADGHVRPEVMVGDVIGLDALPGRLEALRQGAASLKVQVDPTRA